MATIAEFIVETLSTSGVERVYGLSGDSLNGFTDAVRQSGLDWVHVRHEEAAAFAASAEAAMTGEIAVCAGSCGPGNLHLINGLYDAQRSRVPVLALAAHIPSSEIGSGYFQETHPQAIFAECSVYVEHVSSAEQMPRLLRIAMREALTKRGVAVLVISGDLLLTEIEAEAEEIRHQQSLLYPDSSSLARAAEALNAGERVTILAGAGAAGAHDELIAAAERLKAPVVHALRGKENVEYDNPHDVGMSGLIGFESGYHALHEADTLLMLGTDFPYTQFYPEHATIIQVDIRGEQIGRRTRVDIPLVGGVKETLDVLLPHVEQKRSRKHLDAMLELYESSREGLDDLTKHSRRTIHPQRLTRLIDEAAADDAVFIPDVGSPVVMACRYVTTNGRRRLIGSFTHGSMANALPQAIGVQASHPERQVIALAGDGGLAMLLGELLTVRQLDLPIKIVVYNNSSLNFVELEMKAAGVVNYATELENPRFSDLAEAIGITGIRVDRPKDLEKAVTEFMATDGPALLDVVTERQELTLPPSIEAEQVKGFSAYAVKTVLDGRGGELIDLAKANARQLF
ncbi:ubiquinone-dependent pyruvate dehydrogenase [Flaviflexus salsibiostraticola]|uniref:Ubiquinone-dependent pyruvate dehydrogenase n=1 Tax=Flaviflexus salsibiostraticola TaxID=1282737 RepID=A0A3Q8WUH9_9ACTO|nr:ubiquinone-dependent pyruvate dehydrogenase [Flaviflexus salsibiostraticola]AZN30633.1 ubiquinone-dependent pyruvate dehydrogenase [Flaviflexus salsibiostraticola]